jgi:lysophospholipid acyltransferase 1/2
MEKTVLMVSMAYLCVYHLYRMYYDYGGYTLDISGPLMLLTQRLSSLAFNLRDGREKDELRLTPMMKRLAVKEMPNRLELASYIFCFHLLICSPFCFYKDYIAFIEGTNYAPLPLATASAVSGQTGNNVNNHGYRRGPPPFAGMVLVKKVLTSIIFGLSTIFIIPKFPATLITGPQFREQSFLHKNFLVWFLTFLQRQKYYFGWKLSEAVNVSCGLGYNGVDERGQARWNLVDNADILKIELSTSQKQLLDSWNKTTISWLRYVVYERFNSTMAVFVFSAFWHGFYGGYYLTFVSAGLLLNTAKMARRKIRPYFQTSRCLMVVYSIWTFFVTHITMSYVGFPFMILEFTQCITIYHNLYFWQHIAVIMVMLILLLVPVQRHLRAQ